MSIVRGTTRMAGFFKNTTLFLSNLPSVSHKHSAKVVTKDL